MLADLRIAQAKKNRIKEKKLNEDIMRLRGEGSRTARFYFDRKSLLHPRHSSQ